MERKPVTWVCSACGKEAAVDSRMGSTNHYLACGCDRNGAWIDDGRGGYWQPHNNARPIPIAEFLAAKSPAKRCATPGCPNHAGDSRFSWCYPCICNPNIVTD